MFYAITLKKIKRIFVLLLGIALCVFGSCVVVQLYLPIKYLDIIQEKAEKYGLDPALVCGIIRTESRFRTDVVSPKGAKGLMQIMKGTGDWAASEIGHEDYAYERICEPELNIELGCWYLNRLLIQFENKEVALAAYNAGSGNVSKWLQDPRYSHDGKTLYYIPFQETRKYVQKVENFERWYRRLAIFELGF